MKISYKKLELYNLLFCYTPVFLFLLGWCRWIISVPLTALIIYMFYRYYRVQWNKEIYSESFTIERKVWYGMLIGAAVLGFLLGYGGINVNTELFGDYVRNGAVSQDLARYNWPVIYEDAQTPSMLTYYLGLYLFPGLIGNLFNSPLIGELSLGIIGYIGMILVFVNIIRIVDARTVKSQMWAVLIYLGFSGSLVLLQLATFYFNSDVELGSPHWFTYLNLQYRSTLVCLKWAFPQYYVPIICMILLYTHRGERTHYAVWILPALLCGTWAFTALVMFAIGDYIITSVRDRKFHWDIFSWQNFLCAGIGLLMLTYLLGCWSADTTNNMQLQFVTNWKYYLISYLPFCLFMFGIYFMLIWKDTQKDDFFYLTLCILCFIPFMRAGKFNDWVMGVSMPALFMLTIYCIRFLVHKPTNAVAKKKWIALIILIALNFPYPVQELYRSWGYSKMPERTMRKFSCKDCEDIPLGWRTYFTNYNYNDSFFYKHIARK